MQKIPPPQGVDPAKLENYLSDSDFQVRLDFFGSHGTYPPLLGLRAIVLQETKNSLKSQIIVESR